MSPRSNLKLQMFKELAKTARECRLCERMVGRRRVLSEKNGKIHSKILFVAEAPGRMGADRTGVPFTGDQSGRNFQDFIDSIGLTRHEIFISNAILCNPRDEKDNNGTPKKSEIANCSRHLQALINIIKPKIIITLGQKALDALKLIHDHDFKLREAVGNTLKWNGSILFPLYHPSPRAFLNRNKKQQFRDYRKLRKILNSQNSVYRI